MFRRLRSSHKASRRAEPNHPRFFPALRWLSQHSIDRSGIRTGGRRRSPLTGNASRRRTTFDAAQPGAIESLILFRFRAIFHGWPPVNQARALDWESGPRVRDCSPMAMAFLIHRFGSRAADERRQTNKSIERRRFRSRLWPDYREQP